MRYFIIGYSFLVILAVFGCKESSTISGTTEPQELIVNGSFEQNGNPSLDGWSQSLPDTTFAQYSIDAAPDGGLYSISLVNGWGPLPKLQAYVFAPLGTYSYRLSVWSKCLAPVGYSLGSIGGIEILHLNNGIIIHSKKLSFSDSLWTEYMLIDTINSSLGDKLIVSLSTGQMQWHYGRTLFDNVSFLKLN